MRRGESSEGAIVWMLSPLAGLSRVKQKSQGSPPGANIGRASGASSGHVVFKAPPKSRSTSRSTNKNKHKKTDRVAILNRDTCLGASGVLCVRERVHFLPREQTDRGPRQSARS